MTWSNFFILMYECYFPPDSHLLSCSGGLFLLCVLTLCFPPFSVCRAPLCSICIAVLMVRRSFSLCCSWKLFIFLSVQKDNHCNLSRLLFSSRTGDTSFYITPWPPCFQSLHWEIYYSNGFAILSELALLSGSSQQISLYCLLGILT